MSHASSSPEITSIVAFLCCFGLFKSNSFKFIKALLVLALINIHTRTVLKLISQS